MMLDKNKLFKKEIYKSYDKIRLVVTIFGIKFKFRFKNRPKFSACDIGNEQIIKDNHIILPHPVGIVISKYATLGRNLMIYQNVTIGVKNFEDALMQSSEYYPTIGDNTKIYAGAVVVGGIKVGKNCTIGANSVVMSDIPDGATVVGCPARVVKLREAETGVVLGGGENQADF